MARKTKKNIFYEWDSADSVLLALMLAFSLFVISIWLIAEDVQAQEVEPKDTYLSSEIQEYCVEVGNGLGICPELLMAMVEAESSGRKYAENGNCVGLMQVNKYTWSDMMYRMQIYDIYDEHDNILLGASVLLEYIQKCEGDVAWALMKYNGFSKADYYIKNGWLSPYAEKILERTMELEDIHYGREGEEEHG